MFRVENHKASSGFTERTAATVLRKASPCISIINSTWNCNEANSTTFTIDHLQRIHLQRYYVDESVIEWLSPAVLQRFCSPSRIICESHIWDVFHQALHVVFHSKKRKKKNHGFVSKREEREVVGLSQFVAYIPNKESWKPVRDQSYSPKGLTARCPHNTFKASNSPPDQMQPGSGEKHWPLRLEPVFARSYSRAVAWGMFFKDK